MIKVSAPAYALADLRKRFSYQDLRHMGSIERTRELRRQRSRRQKLKKLRDKFAKLTNDADKATLMTKARKVSPFVEFE